jgi:hypothetical protein
MGVDSGKESLEPFSGAYVVYCHRPPPSWVHAIHSTVLDFGRNPPFFIDAGRQRLTISAGHGLQQWRNIFTNTACFTTSMGENKNILSVQVTRHFWEVHVELFVSSHAMPCYSALLLQMSDPAICIMHRSLKTRPIANMTLAILHHAFSSNHISKRGGKNVPMHKK